MRYTAIFISFLFLPQLLQGQMFTISESFYTGNDYSYVILPDGRGNVLLFKDQKGKFHVHAFDDKMQPRWDKELELDKKRPEIIDVISTGGDFCIFYQFRKKGDAILKAHLYNPAANLIDSITFRNFGSRLLQSEFEVVLSENKKVALLYFVEDSKAITALAFHMGEMKLLWEKTFSPEKLIWHQEFSQIIIDNGGNMYLSLKRENRKSRIEDHYLEIINYGEHTGYELLSHKVNMKGRLTFDVKLAFDNLNGILSGGGLYSIENPLRAEGYFILRIPKTNPGQPFLEFKSFDDEFVNILLEKEKSKNKGIGEVSVQEIVLRRDGGLILIGELNRSYERGMSSPNYYTRSGTRPVIDFFYDDIFMISIHPGGEEHWKAILHKKQYSQGDDAMYSSYFLAKTPAMLRVIFNEEITSDNLVSEYVIQGNGAYDRHAVMSTERLDLALRFRDAVQVSSNEIIIPSERRNLLKLVRIVY